MFHAKRWRVAVVVACATLLVAPSSTGIGDERRCTIVTNGNWGVYLHELAHCNGWVHPLFASDQYPPPGYMHDFEGELTIIGADLITRLDAQAGTKFLTRQQPVPEICRTLWAKQGLDVSAYTDAINKIVGCSVKD
jgi:hypothetical protein